MGKYDVVIPALKEDLIVFNNFKDYYMENLQYNKIIIITRDPDSPENDILYIDENSLFPNLTFKNVYNKIKNLGGDPARTGWYFQQFLKMSYAFHCKDEYYLLWDTDTVPINCISMFDGNKPVFHMKKEYHKPYFDTLFNLTDGKLKKKTKKSFISEHMLINTEIMKKMISFFKEKNGNNEFWENILESINIDDLSKSGFSEFESYGTYVLTYFPDVYKLKKYDSCRLACRMFGRKPSIDDIKWAKKSFDALSLEKYDSLSKYSKIWNKRIVRFLFSCRFIYRFYCKISRIRNK